MTRLPIIKSDWLALGDGGRVALRANVALPDEQTLDFVSVKLHDAPEAREARLEQVMRLTGWLNERARVPAQVVAGDFGEARPGPAVAHMKQAYRSAYAAAHGRDPVATYPTALVPPEGKQSGCFDYIFLSRAAGRVEWADIFCDRHAGDDATLYPSDHVGLLTAVAEPARSARQLRVADRVRV